MIKNEIVKDYKIAIEQGFVHVLFYASVFSSSVKEGLTQSIHEARKAGFYKILYDFLNVTGHVTTLERFNYASRIAKQFRGFKVAFAVNQSLRDPDLFGETVAVNRGADIRVLATLAEAYNWLEVEPADQATGSDGK